MSPSASRPSTMAGTVPLRVPMWRCQFASQSKDWKTVRSAWRSNDLHSVLDLGEVVVDLEGEMPDRVAARAIIARRADRSAGLASSRLAGRRRSDCDAAA